MSNIRKTAIAITLGISVASLAGCGGGGGGGGGGGDNGGNGGDGGGNGPTPVLPDTWNGLSTTSGNGATIVQGMTAETLAGAANDSIALRTQTGTTVLANTALLSLGQGFTFQSLTTSVEGFFLSNQDRSHGLVIDTGGSLEEGTWRVAVVEKDASPAPYADGALGDLAGQWSGWIAAAFSDTYYEYPATMVCASQFCTVTASGGSLDANGDDYAFGPPVGTQTQFELTHREQKIFDHDRGVFMTSPDNLFVGATRCGRFLPSCEVGAFSRTSDGGGGHGEFD